MSFFSEMPRYLKKKLHSVFSFTNYKAYLYATVGQILFFKPYRTIFDSCVHLLLREVLAEKQCKLHWSRSFRSYISHITFCGYWKVYPWFFKLILCNPYQSSPYLSSLFLYGLLVSPRCFSVLVNYYFQVFFDRPISIY